MKKTILISAVLLLLGISGFAQYSIDYDLVRKALQKQTPNWRNSIEPKMATYYTNEDAIVPQRDIFSYNADEFYLEEVLTEFRDMSTWHPQYKMTYSYNFNMDPIEILGEEYIGNDWEPKERNTMEYDMEGLVTILSEETIQKWENNDWVNFQQYSYEYDPVITILVRDWNTNHFENHYLYTIEQDDAKATILLQYWMGGAWQNQEEDVIEYNENSETKEIVHKIWGGTSWVNETRHLYEYDGPYQLSRITISQWDNGEWSTTKFKTVRYEHDGMGNSIHASCESNSGSGEENNADIEMFYNEGNSITFEHVADVTMEYIDVTGIDEPEAAAPFVICPNPAQGRFTVQGDGFLKAELFSLTGQRILESHTAEIDLQGLASGAYLVKVYHIDGTSATQKLLVE